MGENDRQQQFICYGLYLFVVKAGMVTDDDLTEVAGHIATGWKRLGRRLRVPESVLKGIDMSYQDQLEKAAYQMLKYWKQRQGVAATYSALHDALQHELVNRRDLAEMFCYD